MLRFHACTLIYFEDEKGFLCSWNIDSHLFTICHVYIRIIMIN